MKVECANCGRETDRWVYVANDKVCECCEDEYKAEKFEEWREQLSRAANFNQLFDIISEIATEELELIHKELAHEYVADSFAGPRLNEGYL